MKLLRFSDLCERNIVRNWVTLKRWQATQGFPFGKLLGPNTRVWTEVEIDYWLASRPEIHATNITPERESKRPISIDRSGERRVSASNARLQEPPQNLSRSLAPESCTTPTG